MKKLINGVDNVVDEMLRGMTAAHPEYVERVEGTDVVIRTGAKETDKVVLISGGGSGHEPAHGGFVGKGMLDGAVAGAVFTSPTPDQVYEAIKATECGKGALLIIKNYTGDVLNFEMAADMASDEDIEVAQVIVADDVAVENSTWTTGRRGIAGTIFVHKIAGAKAEEGASLEEVKAVAEKVIANVRSMGMGILPCTVPAVGKPGFELGDDEMEIGMGIHGEPGIEVREMMTADEIAAVLVEAIEKDMPLPEGSEVSVMVNGLGATPLEELLIVYRKIALMLKERGVTVFMPHVGEFATSMEMAGLSVTVMKLDEELKHWLSVPAVTPFYTSLNK